MKQKLNIMGIPMDLGQSRRGVDMGPSAIRYAGLNDRLRKLGFEVQDFGNIDTPVRDELSASGGLDFMPAVIKAALSAYEMGMKAFQDGSIPLFLGGDHAVALGTVTAAVSRKNTGIFWIDAHSDFNTPATSPSGNLHGMPLAAITGRGDPKMVNFVESGPIAPEEDIVVLGLRSVDSEERRMLRQSAVSAYTMRDIDELGIGAIARQALEKLSHCERIHVSLDMDVMDPREAPGVGTPVAGGLTYRETHLLMEILAASKMVGSVDVVEINPILDERNRTSQIAVELVASLLGQSIL